jgi:hypothetical protein
MMRDFLLDDGFLQSCIDLPEETRRKIVSQLEAFANNPRDRDLGVTRVEGSRHILSLPIDDIYSIVLRREKPATILLLVSTSAGSKRGSSPEHMITASVDALGRLLVEEKYLLLAKHLLDIPRATKGLQFRISEIETIVHAHLPPEARRFPNWWANQKSGKRPQSFAWMAAGWVVSKIDLDSGLVKFVRAGGAN